MKNVLLWTLLGTSLVVGCRTRYELTLNNAYKVTSVGKPKLINGFYVFKDPAGHTNAISELRVRQIQPQSSAESEDAIFKPRR